MEKDKPTCLLATTDRILRRARNLTHAIGAYRCATMDLRTMCEGVALIVTHEEYDDLKNDDFLWAENMCGAGALEVRFGDTTDIRLYGILVLPR